MGWGFVLEHRPWRRKKELREERRNQDVWQTSRNTFEVLAPAGHRSEHWAVMTHSLLSYPERKVL
jgi:hypothetical protein